MSEGKRYGCSSCKWTGYIVWRDKYERNMATMCQCLRQLAVERVDDEVKRYAPKKRWRKKNSAVSVGDVPEVSEWQP